MTVTASEPEALQLLRARDPDALSEVVTEYTPSLYRAILSMGVTGAAAEDLLQDVFVTFLTTLDHFEGRSKIRTWLFGILYRKLFEARRELARVDKHDPIDGIVESWFNTDGSWAHPPADIERVLASQEAGLHIRACVDALPPLQRAAFELREIDELTSSEICEALGISTSNFGVLMHRARMKLRVCLEDRGVRQ